MRLGFHRNAKAAHRFLEMAAFVTTVRALPTDTNASCIAAGCSSQHRLRVALLALEEKLHQLKVTKQEHAADLDAIMQERTKIDLGGGCVRDEGSR